MNRIQNIGLAMLANYQEQPQLIRSLLQSDRYDHPSQDISLIETHISWVILTGEFAYKIKKPINLGFLDFSTLSKRRLYCEEELRLNSRLADAIYLEVVSITGSPEQPVLNGAGVAIEYAIKMVQFPQQAQLDNMLACGELENHHIDDIASMVAQFHQTTAVAAEDSSFGDPEYVYHPVAENFSQIKQHLQTTKYDDLLTGLNHWSETTFEALKPIFNERKRNGYIRECHGDMHLRNLVWFDGKPLAFDCLEFNPALRWIDTMSEVAFLVMDLQDRGQPLLAHRFLNRYLEQCGDYEGVQILRFYLVYRALVRAKVDSIRARQQGIDEAEKREAEEDFHAYLRLAQSYTQQHEPKLIITRGMSASGKSTLTQPLLEAIGAIRIRSDVERKRLFGIQSGTEINTGIGQGIYSADASVKTYNKLKQLSRSVLQSGFPVIVDAAFLKYGQREPFMQLALQMKIPFVIVEFTASASTLRQRIRARVADVSDADLSVLEHQLATIETLQHSELSYRIELDTEKDFNVNQLVEQVEHIITQNSPKFRN